MRAIISVCYTIDHFVTVDNDIIVPIGATMYPISRSLVGVHLLGNRKVGWIGDDDRIASIRYTIHCMSSERTVKSQIFEHDFRHSLPMFDHVAFEELEIRGVLGLHSHNLVLNAYSTTHDLIKLYDVSDVITGTPSGMKVLQFVL